jgi:hypothetical protein
VQRISNIGKFLPVRGFLLETRRRGIAAAVALSLAGCLATNLEKYNRIDPREKTIFIPAENAPLIGTIAQGLRADGWAIADAVAPAAKAEPRYRIDIRQIRVDPEFCDAGGGQVVKFDLVMYDNRTSDAALTYRGRDCSNWAATAFLDAVRRYVKHPRREFDD